ncbi:MULTISPECIES: PilW family protein [unclassified Polaromonas]|uniref:PilW family protein n=1 Tax=unclassified Polaromonas TaxID=2638319 RepID=UPI0013DDEC7E|nr:MULTISPECIES: PilW family protein [unclassified Polaromonas]
MPGSRSAATRQSGFTLIELLISMTLGMVIIGALVVMYVSGSTATRNAQAQGQMNEDAQMALSVFTQELRQAGYNPTRAGGAKNDLGQAGWNLFACNTGFTDATVANISALTCAAGGGFALAVAYEGDLNSGKNTSTGLPMDCIGNGVGAAGAAFYTMQSRLAITNNTLTCRGSGNLAQSQVLAENIESATVNFALTEPAVPNSQNVRGYLTASGIAAPTDVGLAALSVLDRWNKVVAAQVCIVVRSEDPVLGDLGTAATKPSYQNCAGANVDIADGRLRRAYRTTVLLRNHGVGYVNP